MDFDWFCQYLGAVFWRSQKLQPLMSGKIAVAIFPDFLNDAAYRDEQNPPKSGFNDTDGVLSAAHHDCRILPQ